MFELLNRINTFKLNFSLPQTYNQTQLLLLQQTKQFIKAQIEFHEDKITHPSPGNALPGTMP